MPISSYRSSAAGRGGRAHRHRPSGAGPRAAGSPEARPNADTRELRRRLSAVGLAPTRQRLALARLLYGRGHRHFTPGQLYLEARAARLRVSHATVYNTLHAFVTRGLLREISVEPNKSYFDTNLAHVCHAFFSDTGELRDLQTGRAELKRLAARLGGVDPERMSIVIYVDGKARRRARSGS